MEVLMEKLSGGSFLGEVMVIIISLNLFLIGLQGAVEKAQDLIPGDQSGFLKGLKLALRFLGKIIDMAGMNKQHKK